VDVEGDVTFSGDIYAPGSDIGTMANPLGTGYFTTINASSIVGPISTDGTTFNTWTVNTDALAATPENVGLMWQSADGTNIDNWRQLTTASGNEFHFQYKVNPTDYKDLTEGGYTDFLWFDSTTGETHIVDLSVSNDITLVNGGTITTTNNGDITLDPHGTGQVVVDSNIFLDGFDIGTPGNPAGDIYATNISGTFTGTIAACGTSCNVWEVNNDAAAGTSEDTGLALPAGDGASIRNFQFYNNSSSSEMELRYKQNPTDPADFSEGGYTDLLFVSPTRVTAHVALFANLGADVSGAPLNVDANGIDCAGNIDLNNTLSFDGVGTIDTSGNNNLTLNVGTASLLATAGTVDLQTNVTTLDVPDQTGFSIGGTALTTTLWTAAAVDTVFGGPASNADAYHTHSGSGSPCGTSCNRWEINDDAVGTTAEDVGVMFPGGDGVNVQNFQFFNDTSSPEMILRYKQNPTDPSDMAEGGYTNILSAAPSQVTVSTNVDALNGLDVTNAPLTVDANGIDSGGSIDLAGTLSFDAAGTIDTSGNNNLTVNVGLATILVTAGTVDLQNGVTVLDVPDQTGFSIGGSALTTTLWTATAVDVVFGGPASNADAYHTHSSAAVGNGTNSNVWQVNKDVSAGTQEYAGSVWLDGDGATNVEGWRVRNDGGTQEFKIQYKQNPTDPSDLTESWTDILTATPTAVTVNAPTFNANTINATTITGTFTGTIGACGTSCNVWEVNNDAAGGTAEDAGTAFPGGDGANVQNFQFFNDTSVPEMVLRYKQNPTDPADLAEAGYTTIMLANTTRVAFVPNVDMANGLDVGGAPISVDANGIDSGGAIDLVGTLSFDAAGTIDTSGNNNLTLDSGTASILATAGTVDLQTNVTTLDVPDQTGFSIGGSALTTTLWTATGVDTVFGGPAVNADAYHTHSGGTASNTFVVSGMTTAAVSQYYACYISANNTVAHCDARDTGAGGSYQKATFAGVYGGTSGEIVVGGKVEVQFEAALTVAAGDPAFLSWSTVGLFTNVPAANGSKDFQTLVGTILDTTNYAGSQRCVVLINAQEPFEA
jgi:hypothetical protein